MQSTSVMARKTQKSTPPPRVRTRNSKPAADLALSEDVLSDKLPDDLGDRFRVMQSKGSPEMMPWVYDTMYKLRCAGMPFAEIAREFRKSERTIYNWWAKAQEYVKHQHTNLDPAGHFARRMEEFSIRRKRLLTLLLNTKDTTETARLSMALERVDVSERNWLREHGYFTLFPFGKLAGGDENSAESQAERMRKALTDAFSGVEEDGWDGEDATLDAIDNFDNIEVGDD